MPKAVEQAVQRLLRPLVRLLLSFQVTFPVLSEWLKRAYVDVAEKEFPLNDKPQTDTRISLLTGIHRKDMKRLRHASVDNPDTPESVSVGVQLAARWMGDPAYLDAQKQPRPLPFKQDSGESFETLVEAVVKKDIRARVVLDEWLRLEVVSEDEQGLLHLNPGAFVPHKGLEEKAFFLGMNVADHLAAATENVRGESTPNFERCVYYDGLSEQAIATLKAAAEARGMETLVALNEQAMLLKQQQPGKQRINMGMYVFHEAQSDHE